VNTQQCRAVLDNFPDIVPALDYERVVGTEIWVPQYSATDEISEAVKNLPADVWESIQAVLSHQGEIQELALST
jgi:hypothetical protein